MFTAASEDRLRNFWSELEAVDSSLKYGGVYRKPQLKELAGLNAFMQHCCQSRHYSFSIKKCGEASCEICRTVRMPMETFNKIHHLPDQVPGSDGHYSPFSESSALQHLSSIGRVCRHRRGGRKLSFFCQRLTC